MNPSSPDSTGRQRANEPIGIVLCADDYGLAPGLGRAIRHLIGLGRLSATSCMTGSTHWPHEAEALKPLRAAADIGLHLTLTDQTPLTRMRHLAPRGKLPSIMRMIFLAHTGRLNNREIKAEIRAELIEQLDRFEVELGSSPDYLDGHQHVHQLPVVRDIVLDVFQERLRRAGSYLRYCAEPLGAALGRRHAAGEAIGISILGRRFARLARTRGIPGNLRFAGVHDFSGRVPYARLFDAFLTGLAPGTLIMCHPGIADAELAAADPVTTRREEEYVYFLSDDFPMTLNNHHATLVRFANINSPKC